MANAKYKYKDYVESDAVRKAQEALNAQLQNKPGAYQSQWQSNLDDLLNRIQNREKFTYDLNGDALYQQYKDQYITQGKLAMQDTMGQAAALTGGYGNSYAATVGNQAYQSSLQNLNNVIPELYSLAYERYNQEGQDLYNQYALIGEREAQDYNRYRDTVSDWESERDYLANRYDSERNYDYGKYTDDRNFDYGVWTDNRNYEYQQERDRIADAQWQKEFDEAKRQYEATMAYNRSRSSGSSGSGGGRSSSGSSSSVWGDMTDAQIKRAMNLNEDIDGAVAYLEDTGYITEENQMRAALRKIGYTDSEINAYLNQTKSSYRGSGGGKGQQTVSLR